MTWDIGIVLLTLFFMCLGLIREWARPELVVASALAFLVVIGVIEPSQALRGFSNEGILTIALLFIVAGAVQQSGFLKSLIHYMLGKSPTGRKAMVRMLIPVAGFSAFMNNTPIVVMLTPIVRRWCQEHGISPSKLLLPLSYATLFGGMITLVGTSTNLVVHGLMIENGLSGFSMFSLAVVGIPGAVVALGYMISMGYRLLPERKGVNEDFHQSSRDYLVEMRVGPDCPLIGKTLKQGNLRNLSGLYLFEIIRDGRKLLPVHSDEVIYEGDRLIFVGMVNTIVELQQIKGLLLETGTNIQLNDLRNEKNQILEVVISHQSGLVNRTVKQNQFRKKFGAAVIAVHRGQERIDSKIGDIVLKPGDILLLIADEDFIARYRFSEEFYFINVPEQPEVVDPRKSTIAIITLAIMVLLVSFNLMSMFKSAILAVLILAITRSITLESVKRSIHFDVLLLIACAFGMGAAMETSGAAQLLSGFIVDIGGVIGTIGILLCLYLLTNICTELLSNTAVVAIMFPIALTLIEQLQLEPLPVMVVLAIAASAGFSTPIGYQTNMIVFSPGGYRFVDYVKVGLPLNLIYMNITVTMVAWIW